ncbi:MAG TPA: GNAT family N-acetyltransferase [Candidatus Cybelea sp.]
MSTTFEIRAARLDDAEELAALMNQLGYDVPVVEIAQRLRRREERRAVFVATRGDRVVGWAAVSTDETFVEGFGAHLEGLVVEETARGLGAGAHLIEAAETWARDRGCNEMRVQSNVVRRRAHAFYNRHGYATIKSQYHLRKPL